MTVKESFHVAGLPSTWGFPGSADHRPRADALAVARVKAAGAVVLGATNVPLALGDVQTYNDVYGTTANPWDRSRTPGGSSGGSSAALAAGFGALSLGSDNGGSLRIPAHFCGVHAHRPTLGLLPLRGHTPPGAPVLPTEAQLAVTGPMARSATDLALLLDVLAGPDELAPGAAYRLALPAPRHDALRDFRVLVVEEHPSIPTSAAVRAVVDRFATDLAAAGAAVSRRSPLLPDQEAAARLYMRMLASELGADFPARVYEKARAAAEGLPADDRSLTAERARGTVLSHRGWIHADAERAVLRQRWRELFAEVDVVVAAVAPTPAFPHDHGPVPRRTLTVDGTDHPYLDQLALPGVATLPGLPATAFPAGATAEALPVGLQAIGPAHGDRTTIRFAELAEREFGGFRPPPL
jgi:amidase